MGSRFVAPMAPNASPCPSTSKGPTLVFVRRGNIAIQLGVDDPLLPGEHAGAFVTLADDRGVPLLYVAAEEDGSLHIRTTLAGEDPP